MLSEKAQKIIQRYFRKDSDPLFRELSMLKGSLDDELLYAAVMAHHNKDPVLTNVEVLLSNLNNQELLLATMQKIYNEFSNGYAAYYINYSGPKTYSHHMQLSVKPLLRVFDLINVVNVDSVYIAKEQLPHFILMNELQGDEAIKKLRDYQKRAYTLYQKQIKGSIQGGA